MLRILSTTTTTLATKSSNWTFILTSGTWVTCSLSNIHGQKKISDQHWYEMQFHLWILHRFHMVTDKWSENFDCLIHVHKNYSDPRWYKIHYHLSTHKFYIVTGRWSEKFRLSPYELVTIWKKWHSPIKIINVTIWICHHLKNFFNFISIWTCHQMNNIHISHHFGMKF